MFSWDDFLQTHSIDQIAAKLLEFIEEKNDVQKKRMEIMSFIHALKINVLDDVSDRIELLKSQ